MRVTVVGCSGSYPGPESPASCYLVEEDLGDRRWRILLDLGNGALGALQRHVDPLQVDAVVLSHLHPDHCMDLCGFYVLRRYHPGGSQPRIPVYGPAGTSTRMMNAYGLEEPGMAEEFRFVDLSEPFSVGPFQVTPVGVEHPVAAYSLRVEAGGRTLTYSGDTAPCAALVEAARDADLFLCEASFLEEDDNPPGIHLTGADAAVAAGRAGAKRLLLTHVPPWHEPRTVLEDATHESFHGDVGLAEPGRTYQV